MNMKKDLVKILTKNPNNLGAKLSTAINTLWHIYENLEPKKPLDPGTGMGRIIGK